MRAIRYDTVNYMNTTNWSNSERKLIHVR